MFALSSWDAEGLMVRSMTPIGEALALAFFFVATAPGASLTFLAGSIAEDDDDDEENEEDVGCAGGAIVPLPPPPLPQPPLWPHPHPPSLAATRLNTLRCPTRAS